MEESSGTVGGQKERKPTTNPYILETNFGIKNHRAAFDRIIAGSIPRGVTFIVGPGGSRLHTSGEILYCQSEYFRRLLHGKTLIEIRFRYPALDNCAVDAILRCLFSGTLSIYPQTVQQIHRVMKACIEFELEDLRIICMELFRRAMGLENSYVGDSDVAKLAGELPPNLGETELYRNLVENAASGPQKVIIGAVNSKLEPCASWVHLQAQAQRAATPPQSALGWNVPIAEKNVYVDDSRIPVKRRRVQFEESPKQEPNGEEPMDQ